jgi:hypothetical protein
MELDMEFDGDEDDDGEVEEGSGRSGSAELEGMEDGERKDWEKLALGSGSGGVKGRRKGMVFKCENCSKVSDRSVDNDISPIFLGDLVDYFDHAVHSHLADANACSGI